MLINYLPILLFLVLATGICVVLLAIPFILANFKKDKKAKYIAYESGSEPIDNDGTKRPVNIRFYLVAILFVIFDVEVAFLFPYVLAFEQVGLTGYIVMMTFLAILTVGFIYEWKKGALEWN